MPTIKTPRRPHAKRAVFDLLLDEIDGTREVEFNRVSVSDTSDMEA